MPEQPRPAGPEQPRPAGPAHPDPPGPAHPDPPGPAHPDPPGWLDDATWAWVQTHVPIACVDVLALPGPGAPGWARFGLIRRATPHQGERWCLLGGRVRYGEALDAAARRHVQECLGPAALVGDISGPICVCEYLPGIDLTRLHDPRQHALATVVACHVSTDIVCAGEAHRFGWFASIEDVPDWGFRQDLAVSMTLSRLPGCAGAPSSPGPSGSAPGL